MVYCARKKLGKLPGRLLVFSLNAHYVIKFLVFLGKKVLEFGAKVGVFRFS